MKYRSLNKSSSWATLKGKGAVVGGQEERTRIGNSSTRRAQAADCIELLESRIAPALITAVWLGGDGNWSDASKWNIGVVPNNGGGNEYNVVLDVPGTATITLAGSINIHSLSNAEHLDIVGSFYSPTYVHLTAANSLTNNGSIEIISDEQDANRCQLYFDEATTIAGTGDIQLTGYPMLNAAQGADVTISTGQKVHGFGYVNAPSLDNAGLFDADVAGKTLFVTTSGVNSGTLQASAGTLQIANTTFDNTAGFVKADGGIVQVVNSSLPGGHWIATDNPASRIRLVGNVDADGASWQATGAGEFQVYYTTATLSGDVTFTGGKFSLLGYYYEPMRFNYAGGTFTNNGTIELVSDEQDASRGQFSIQGNATFAGVGDLKMIGYPLLTTAPGVTLTLDAGQKVHGYGIITGSYANSGTIEADTGAKTLYLSGPTIVNTNGTLSANGGHLLLQHGTTVTGGNFVATDNPASQFDFNGTIGVDGTTWTGHGAGLFRVPYTTATLNGIMHLAEGEFDVLGYFYAPVRLNLGGGTFTNDGLIKLFSDNQDPGRSAIYLNNNVTLTGDGTLNLIHTPSISGAAGTRLTIGVDQLVHGSGVVNVPLLTNAGTITADTAGETLTVTSTGVNTKLMDATAGTLRFDGANLANTGATICADGANVSLVNSTITGGDIVATDNAASRVFLIGTVNADGTTWRAQGSGEFQVPNTTATLNGDVHLASGKFALIGNFYAPMLLNMGGGTFTNDGLIELISDSQDANRGQLHLNASTTFAGTGDIKLIETPLISGAAGTKLTLGAGQVLHGVGYVNVPGLDNAGIIASDVAARSLVVTATGTNTGLMHASAGTLQLNGSNFTNTGAELRADGGIVELVNSTVTDGNFVATDDAGSRVRFVGNINADATTWTAAGAGAFEIFHATTTLAGAMHLTAGKFTLIGDFYSPLYADLAAGATFTNDGTIELVSDRQNANRGQLRIDGNATLNGSGDFKLIDDPLLTTAPSATLTIGAGQKVHGYGIITGSYANSGTIEADGGANVLYLSGPTIANPNGTLRANGGRLLLQDGTTVTGGAFVATDNPNSLFDFTGTIGADGTTWTGSGAGLFRVPYTTATLNGSMHLAAGEFDLLGYYYAPVRLNLGGGNFTNDGVIKLFSDNQDASRSAIYLNDDVTLNGHGELQLIHTPMISGAAGKRLTFGADQLVHGSGVVNVPLLTNAGMITADVVGETLYVQSATTNRGQLSATSGGTLSFTGNVVLTGAGVLSGDALGLITIAGDLTGDTTGAVRTAGDPAVRFDGPGQRQVEVMDRDLGWTDAGFAGGYSYRTLTVNGATLQLQNAAANTTGSEALYVDELTVPAGATLDLNSQHIYARHSTLDGTVIGDAGAPTSAVTAMPGFWLGDDLLVQWTGADDAGGSGLAAFDLYVSDNGGAPTLWLHDTTTTSARYTVQDGHAYSFYSVARDNVGYVELPPPTPDAATTVHFLAINSVPITGAREDGPYNYDAASNADGLGPVLTWSLTAGAGTLAVDPSTGALSGVFDNAGVGDYLVTLRVDDDQGHHATQTFPLHVVDVVGTFATQTVPGALLGQPFSFDLNSTDEGVGGTHYSLLAGPAWLSIHATTGALSGTPSHAADLASTPVTVRVDDNHGGIDEHTFTLGVQGQLIVLDPALKQTKATFTDANGDLVTVALTGKDGRVDLLRSILPDGSGHYSNLTPADLFAIQLDGTSLKDALTVTVKADTKLHAGDKLTTLGELGGNGSLGKLTASTLDLTGAGLTLPNNTIVALNLHDLKNGADITLGGAQAVKGVSFTAQKIETGSNLTFGSPLKLLKAVEWTNGQLSAPKATSIQVTRTLDANLTLVGALSLLKAGTWSGALSAATLGKVSVLGDVSADLELTNPLAKQTLGSASVGGSLMGAYWSVAGATGVITVAHDLDSATLDLQAKVAAITVKGRARDSLVRSAGDITKLTLGASEHSDFGAGIALNELQSSRHAGDASRPPTATIKSFTVSGLKVPKGQTIPRFFSDSFVSAKIGTMSVHNWDGLGGLWAPTGGIKKIIHHDTLQKDKEHNWVFPEPPKQVSGQPELFVHIL